jgi:hypothetical protein
LAVAVVVEQALPWLLLLLPKVVAAAVVGRGCAESSTLTTSLLPWP